jgi:uncharacterized membrane protein YccC
VLQTLKWLGEFAIDYGSVALFVVLAAVFQIGDRIGDSHPQIEERGLEGLFGLLFAVVAVKLWHDVREDRRHFWL